MGLSRQARAPRPDELCRVVVYYSSRHGVGFVVSLLTRVCGVTPEAACTLALRLDVVGRVAVFEGPLAECDLVCRAITNCGPDASVDPAGPSLEADIWKGNPRRADESVELNFTPLLAVLLPILLAAVMWLL